MNIFAAVLSNYTLNMKVSVSIRFVIALLVLGIKAQGQTNTDYNPYDIISVLQSSESGKGEISLVQPSSLHELLNRHARINKEEGIEGYRIQIFSSSGQDARSKAEQAVKSFCVRFPEFSPKRVYVIYPVPFFKVRVGDFRTQNEAFEFYYKVKRYFPGSYIIKSKINVPENQMPAWEEDIRLEE